MSDTTGTTNTTADANQDAQDQSTQDTNLDSQDQNATDADADADADANKTYDQKYVSDLRSEAAGYRTKAKAEAAKATELQKQLDAINKIFNPDAKSGDAPDPDALAQANTELKRENALLRLAPAAGGEYDLLVDSRSFMESIKDIDPTDTTALSDKIKAAVQSNPALRNKSQGGTRKSGGDLGGGSDEKKMTLEQFKALGYEAKAKMFREDKTTYDKFSQQL